ncbi:RNA polymerase II holoenzyme cyclin-like subunit [Trichodelitschia bisporula]|uniref:RNA polymerase II holoenzyme cyclin-like subunit n=1 Tax=Trichodelitschia bisporula TaxID=703511 RepID=A0A6G1HZJ3_9PEZI|nr:RNA polymerase II holoenzyme cyclin-like subunit [Trichodelitschia bisporula]
MAANYWESSQRKYWTFSKKGLADVRRAQESEPANKQLIATYPLPERRLLNIYFHLQLAKLAKRMSVRQQALATAQVYMRRYYTKVEIRTTNPYLVLATSLYLACKMEECPQHIRIVVGEARQLWPELISSDTSKLGECEFNLISTMNSQLIVHHPYRSFIDLQTTFSLVQEEVSLAWSAINDHFLTDLPLLHPPHVVAITAVLLAVVLKPTQGNLQSHAQSLQTAMSTIAVPPSNTAPTTAQARIQKLITWLAESSVSIEAVVDCVQELISLYDVWESFNEKQCKEQITRFVKALALDK